MRAEHLFITGRVQGVGYRDWLVGKAVALGLAGWVRNVGHDAVEALVAGDAGAVEACVRACWDGPPMAQVVDIERREAVPPGEPGFVRRASVPRDP